MHLPACAMNFCKRGSRTLKNLHPAVIAQSRHASSRERWSFVTTPIFYVNAAPHIGHLHTAVLADCWARWQRLLGHKMLFSTGTDEHGLKIQQAAAQQGSEPRQYCDRVSQAFQSLFSLANISADDFIRTTEVRHVEAVQAFWERLQRGGHLYQASYQGWYSVSDETFLTDQEVHTVVGADGAEYKVSAESGHAVTWMEEKNYMFRLSNFKEQLTAWVDGGAIRPSTFENMVRSWIADLPDLSVSRQRERLSWGIPVPGDDSQTVYVWLDALVNYLTVAGFPGQLQCWPPSVQVIGKDILRFHAVYWPAFLVAADLEPPRQLLCHSHWTVDGQKMSKSLGNVVDPSDRMERYTTDGVRYFLMKEGVPHSDGNYSDRRVVECINSDLVNTLGNLLSRCTSTAINPHQTFPRADSSALQDHLSPEEQETSHSLYTLPDAVHEDYESGNVYRALDSIMGQLRWANGVVQSHAPWQLAKSHDSDHQRHLEAVLHVAMETLRVCGILLQPVVPALADRLLSRLGVAEGQRAVSHARQSRPEGAGQLGGDGAVLLKRIQR